MNYYQIILAVLVPYNIICNVCSVGKPRKPISPLTITDNLLFVILIVGSWGWLN